MTSPEQQPNRTPADARTVAEEMTREVIDLAHLAGLLSGARLAPTVAMRPAARDALRSALMLVAETGEVSPPRRPPPAAR